jgi:hypothetical protein
MTKDFLRKVLDVDPLLEAEKITGKSYKNDQRTEMLGFAIMQRHSQQKNEILRGVDDTLLTNDLDRYVRIIEDMGFERVLEEDFINCRSAAVIGDKDMTEKFFIYAHRDGLLLKFDTFTWSHKPDEVHVNGGQVFYNWKNRGEEGRYCRSSGHYVFPKTEAGGNNYDAEPICWSGDHDCREALRYNIDALRKYGNFLPQWVDCPFMYLSHFGESRENEKGEFANRMRIYEAKTIERIAKLPEWVRQMIGDTYQPRYLNME